MRSFLIIVPEGGMLLEPAGIADILMHANRLLPPDSSQPAYQVRIAATQSQPRIQGLSGQQLVADQCLEHLDTAHSWDTIMVTGKGVTDEEARRVADWIRDAGPRARRVVSICGGALILALAGLLEGRRATTHWRLLDTLQSRFPSVIVEKGPTYIQDGAVWTSAGVNAGFDLTLALVEEDHGFTLARDLARDMVMYLHRPGGPSRFNRTVLTEASKPGQIRLLQSWILENLDKDLSVEALASRAAMSSRNFTRIFRHETGTTPARYVTDARLYLARQLLEQSRQSIEQIATAVGLGNSLNLRRVFERHLQLTPSEYQQQFQNRNLA